MRTIRVELETPIAGEGALPGLFGSAVPKLRISTEVIVGDDIDARDAGRDACATLNDFIAGYAEEVQA